MRKAASASGSRSLANGALRLSLGDGGGDLLAPELQHAAEPLANLRRVVGYLAHEFSEQAAIITVGKYYLSAAKCFLSRVRAGI